MIDSVAISTMTSSRKCSQMIPTTTNYGTVLQYCFQSRTISVHVSIQSRHNAKTTFLLNSNKCADEKQNREYYIYCHSTPVYGVSSDIYSVARAISISGLRDHIATFRCCSSSQSCGGTLFELVTVENPRLAVGIISTLCM